MDNRPQKMITGQVGPKGPLTEEEFRNALAALRSGAEKGSLAMTADMPVGKSITDKANGNWLLLLRRSFTDHMVPPVLGKWLDPSASFRADVPELPEADMDQRRRSVFTYLNGLLAVARNK